MRINNTYICFDFETGSKNAKKTQPLQIAAVAIDGRKLEIIGRFSSYIRGSEDKEYLEKWNLDPISDEALKVNKITWEQIRAAPPVQVVWNNFCAFVNTYNYKKNKWSAPISAGYNTSNFDLKIVNRLCGEEPWKFGPFDTEYQNQSLFNPIYHIDMLQVVYTWFEGLSEPTSLSFDSLRQFMGMPTEASHDAAYDTEQCGELLIRFLKLTRKIATKTRFKDTFVTK
jgi:DNA polymerase III epsilon subunit-like protein